MRIYSTYICHRGLHRNYNQDNIYYQGKILSEIHSKTGIIGRAKWDSSGRLCFGVFDGMGGEQYGEKASYIAVCDLKEILQNNENRMLSSDLMYEFCKKANDDIWSKTKELKAKRIGTTAAFVFLEKETIWCCNLGDSRIYRIRNGNMEQLSIDHSALDPAHPENKPALTAHLGMNPNEMYESPFVRNEIMESGDKFLICSDGLTDMVPEKEIEETISENSVRKAGKKLKRSALKNGGLDNISIIILEVR